MFNLFNRNNKYPSFRVLNTFYKKDHYFTRTAGWGWLDKENIFVTSPKNGKVFSLEPWPQHIFIAANGERTVEEYVHLVAKSYQEDIPGTLDEVIIMQLSFLHDRKLVSFSPLPQPPSPGFDQPGFSTK